MVKLEDLFGDLEPPQHQIRHELEQVLISTKPRISRKGTGFVVHYDRLDSEKENATRPLLITVEKVPLRLQTGQAYYSNRVLIDTNYHILGPLAAEAKMLKTLPPKQRARSVLALLRKHLQYAFPDAIAALTQHDPDRTNWIENNTGLGSKGRYVKLSDIFRNGYAICYHFAFAYLWLCQEAGLEGTPIPVRDNEIHNIIRTDTNTPLFSSVPVGAPTAGHLYVELRMPDGEWLAVDPTTNLAGDTAEGKEMFKLANYQGRATTTIIIECSESRLGIDRTHALLTATEAQTISACQVTSPKKHRVTFKHDIPPIIEDLKPETQFKDVKLTIRLPYQSDIMGLRILNVE